MDARGQLFAAAALIGVALTACAPPPGGQPGVAARPSPVVRPSPDARASEIRSEIAQIGSGPTSAEQEQQADLQRRQQADQATIAEITSQLQSGEADLSARREILASRDQQQQQLRQEQMRQAASSLQASEQLLATRRKQLSQALWPTGETYNDLNVQALENDVTRLQNETTSLRNTLNDISAQSQAAVDASAANQENLINSWQNRRMVLEAQIAQAKNDQDDLKRQSEEISSAVAERQAQADRLKSELKQIGG